ncbi:MAG TPA: DMT family transporter [Stellaceae bacterium]|jgi:drug/metabolite transporter (DMT)-like permease|nr:DMT family transporter [Stellaceae bacterium]
MASPAAVPVLRAAPILRADNVRLGILYMVASVFLFSIQNAIGKWLAQTYPVPMLVFFRSAVALLPSYLFVVRAGGLPVLRTSRLGAQAGRAAIWGGSNVASFFAYHLLPLADAIALTFAAPLFLTALSWPILREPVGRARWIAVSVGFVGVLAMAHPSGAANVLGMGCALACASCNAVGTLTVRDLTRTDHSASIVFYTALFMTLMAVPVLPFYWVTPGLLDLALLCSIGLLGGVSQYWTTQALFHAPATAVSPFNYTALLWGSVLGFLVWGDLPTVPIIIGAAIVTVSGLYLLRAETSRRHLPLPEAKGETHSPG